MARQSLLVVDADQRSLSVLEVSLRNAGYNVAGCASMERALQVLEANHPDLIISDTELDDADGFAFVQRIRQNAAWSQIPFMFLSSDGSIESKIRGLELGVQDYLTKPIYIREVVARVGIELSRHERDDLASRSGSGSKTRFSGSLSEMSVVDLLQTIDVSRKTGVLYLVSDGGERGAMFFDAGALIHAHVGELKGDDAVYRLLLWSEGSFDLEFRRVREGQQTVQSSTQALLMEGMHRLDQWGRLHEQLPSAEAVLEVFGDALRESLGDLPDEQNDLLRLIDGERTIEQVLRVRGGDRLETLRALVDLYFEGVVREAGTPLRSIAVLAEAQGLEPGVWTGGGHDTIPGPGGVLPSDPYAGLGLAAPPAYSRNHKPTTVGFQPAGVQTGPELGLQSPEAPLPASIPSPLSIGAKTADAIPAAAASRNSEGPAPASRVQTAREVDHTPLTVGAHHVDEAPWTEPTEQEQSEPILRSSRPPQPMDRKQLLLDSTRPGPAVDGEQGDESTKPRAEACDELLATPDGPLGETTLGEGLLAGGTVTATATVNEGTVDDGAESGVEVGEAAADEARETAAGSVQDEPERANVGSEEDRETTELPRWDTTLKSLGEDPEVSRAFDEISADPAPAPFVRSIPPAKRDAGPAGTQADREPADGLPQDPAPFEYESGSDREPSRRPLLLAALLLLGGAVLFSLLLRSSPSETETGLEKKVELAFEPERVIVEAKVVEPPAEPATTGAEVTEAETQLEVEQQVSEEARQQADEELHAQDEPSAAGLHAEDEPSNGALGDGYEAQLALARKHKRGALAVSAYRRAIELNPEGTEAMAELGFLMLQRGRNAEAAELAGRASQADPSSSLAWITLGSALQYLKDEDGAMRAYRNCVKHGRGRYVAECRAVLR